MDMADTILSIEDWGHKKTIIENSTSQAQMLKLIEEVGELASGIAKNRPEEVIDAIGDCVVVLTMLAAINKTSIGYCTLQAYNTIKYRKGYMSKEGVFIKEE